MEQTDFDVLIVGAGLSGIGAAYHLQTSCPTKSYAILESRERLGGTWDLFRYPGIRSDSDMYTLGYAFRPWTNPQAIADGDAILAYLQETAEAYGIDRKITYGRRVEGARWSSKKARWSVDVRDLATDQVVTYTCSFLFVCAGYYDYDAGYTPEFAGASEFRGRIVHPQKWTPDIDYDGKRVVVIGSGATAVTLVPELAKRASHVTMLQRSPTYIVSGPERDQVADWLRERFSAHTAYAITRWKNVLRSMGIYGFSRKFPEQAKKLFIGMVRKELGETYDVDKHFTPSYNPWDQRLCLVPDGDLFAAIKEARASVVTDHIERFTERGIMLRSGEEIDADLIVTATGLKLKFLGGLALEVDGQRIMPNEQMSYYGMMLSEVPNLAMAIGYTNASWTLKCDLTSEYVCRLLNYMDKKGLAQCTPVRDPNVQEEPLLNFSSGYIQRSIDDFPRQGTLAPWKVYQNYVLDRLVFRRKRVDDKAMRFAPPPAP
ncbi:MAG: NAD(P)/FAD-dependent oxidoreductase [Polyangiales bacterium]